MTDAKELFGAYPEDVIGAINGAAEALGWLEEIFITIKKEADDARNRRRVEKLAALGAYIALDFSNNAGCQYEEFREQLQKAGVIDSVEASA